MATTVDNELEYETEVWDDEETTQNNKYLLFNMGDEFCGIALEDVTEIVEMQAITMVPDMPVFIKGVINLRGQVIPLMDLRLRFGIDGREYDDRTCVVVVRITEMVVGVIVDTVAEVYDIPASDIDPTPTFQGNSADTQCVSGLAKVEDRVVIFIDVHQLLLEPELAALTTAD
jgi:purine-binding chemotaxis protein CheW